MDEPSHGPSTSRLNQMEEEIERLRRSERINRALFTIVSAVHTAPDLHQLYAAIHRALGSIIDTTNFYIAEYDRTADRVTFPYCVDTVDDGYPPVIEASKTESLRSSVQDEDLKQEIVLQQLDPDLPLPLLRASHKHLDLHKTGLGRWGETLILYNRQRGYKGGKIVPDVSWLDLSDERFRLVGKGARQEVDLSVDYRRLPFGRRHQGELEIQPSQGQRIKVTFLLEMSALDFVAQVVRVMGKGTGKLRRNIQAAHRKTRRPVELHLLLIAFGAFLGFISLQEVGLAVAGVVMGPVLVYTLLLGGLWSRGVVQAARGLGRDQKNNHP